MYYNENHLNELIKSIGKFSRWKGTNTLKWSKDIVKFELSESLNQRYHRGLLLKEGFFDKYDDLTCSLIIFAWGGMNRNFGKMLLEDKSWLSIVKSIRNKSINSREESFNQFSFLRKRGKLKGMGIPYFTKLICFLNPSLNGFIMDQWTSKSINLITQEKNIWLNSQGLVTDKNRVEEYSKFCKTVEDLSKIIDINPLDVEENLFSNGGRKKGLWRDYVIKNWKYNVQNPIRYPI